MAKIAKMIRWCEQQIGSTKYAGRCQWFVTDAIGAATGEYIYRDSAKIAKDEFMKPNTQNDRNPPAGAACYYRGTGDLGARYNHVAVSDGRGYVYEAWRDGVHKHSFDYADTANGGYRGWGWHGNIDLGTQGMRAYGGSAQSDYLYGADYAADGTQHAEISSVVVRSESGSLAARGRSSITGAGSDDEIFLLVQGNDRIYRPLVTGEIKVTRERTGAPGKMTFSYADVDGIDISQGNAVAFRYKNEKVFYGYIFSMEHDSDRAQVSVTCYDQLRYFKNKDSFVYNNTYGGLVQYICTKYGFPIGTIENTGYTLPTRVADGTLFDICGEAFEDTLLNTGAYFTLYDDFGKICLRSLANMTAPILLDADATGKWTLKESIDSDVYNRIVLYQDDNRTGERKLYIANDAGSQAKWGVLTMMESADGTESAMNEQAKLLLNYYNQPKKTFTPSGVLGHTAVRGGSVVLVHYDLGGGNILKQPMVVEKAEHTFAESYHVMDLQLFGGAYSA
ncbi:MAG: hypothetical protein IJ766_01120 [Clostridia bacterium]|nr:hypothetical protein [Clostridia bacterium]